MERKQRIIVLWLMTIGGFACHTLMDLLPLFWGENIAISSDGVAPQGMLLMMAVLSLLLPACGIFCFLPAKSPKWAVQVNVVLAVLIAIFNVAHACMELPGHNAAQYVIMPLMIVISLWLAWDSVRLVRANS